MADLPTSLKPDKITAVSDEFKTKVVEFENRAPQKFAIWHAAKEKYKLHWLMIDATLLATLRAFFTTQQGRWGTWTINDSRIGTGDITVEFIEDTLAIEPLKFTRFNVSAEIQTC